MWWPVHPRRLQRSLLRRTAEQYARHGWPVVPGAYPHGDRFRCDRVGCPINRCHPAIEDWQNIASCDPVRVTAWWSRRGHSVLLPTGLAFDVIEIPGNLGRRTVRLMAQTGLRGPVAVTPTGTWLFFVRHGEDLRPELADQLHVIMHAEGSWVPAPPTRYPEGRVRWRTSPTATGWRLPDPYQVQRVMVELEQPRPHRPVHFARSRRAHLGLWRADQPVTAPDASGQT